MPEVSGLVWTAHDCTIVFSCRIICFCGLLISSSQVRSRFASGTSGKENQRPLLSALKGLGCKLMQQDCLTTLYLLLLLLLLQVCSRFASGTSAKEDFRPLLSALQALGFKLVQHNCLTTMCLPLLLLLLPLLQVRSRFASGSSGKEDFRPLLTALKGLGFKLVQQDAANRMFVVWVLQKKGEVTAAAAKATKWPTLRACMYKKR